MATAIETYTIDNGKPVPGLTHWATWHSSEPRLNCMNLLTTPIAYVSTLPEDPFLSGDAIEAFDPTKYTFTFHKTFVYYAFFPVGNGHSYDADLYPTLRRKGFMWVLNSPGPEEVFVDPWVDWQLAYPERVGGSGRNGWDHIYAPANGTRSTGRVARTKRDRYRG